MMTRFLLFHQTQDTTLVQAQTLWRPPVLSWSVDLVGSQKLTAQSYRFYESPDALILEFLFSNSSSVPITMPLISFSRALAVDVKGEGEFDVTREWARGFQRGVEPGLLDPYRHETVLLSPDDGIGWRLVLRRSDGAAFGEGIYTVSLSFKNALATLRDMEGNLWSNSSSQGGMFQVVISAPVSVRERALLYEIKGKSAMNEDRTLEAIDWFNRSISADPTYPEPFFALADAYLRMNNYREAIPPLEHVIGLADHRSVLVARLLALAYLGTRDRANAERTLRTGGIADSGIPQEIAKLEQLVQRRK